MTSTNDAKSNLGSAIRYLESAIEALRFSSGHNDALGSIEEASEFIERAKVSLTKSTPTRPT